MQEDLDRLYEAIQAASLHYHIYHCYKNDVDRPRYAETLNRYIWFFRPSLIAHFVAMIMALTTIYDKRNDVVSIYTLRRELPHKSEEQRSAHKKIRQGLRELRAKIEKVFILRNYVIAHLSSRLSYRKAFETANITLNDFRDCVNQTGELLQFISRKFDLIERNVADSSKYDVREVLEALTPRQMAEA